jgi:RNA polymerase sigma-70 factor (ECF subfamily)
MHLEESMSISPTDGRTRVLSIMAEVRPELHRYCARLAGSVFDGEDIVQDVFVRALVAADELDPNVPLRPWLFRIAHNRALDHLRSQAVRRSEPIDAAQQVADELTLDPVEAFMRQEAIGTAISHFTQLPIVQRSVVILKDVLDLSLQEISQLLDLSINSVKAALSRGRARLKQINATEPGELRVPKLASAEAARFSSLFNGRDWDALRAMLAENVHLTQATRADRRGAAEVGNFFTIYAGIPEFHLVPAYLYGGYGDEVIAVFARADDDQPAYMMKVEWRESQIVRIRDFRYADYILDGADVVLAAPRNDPEAGSLE